MVLNMYDRMLTKSEKKIVLAYLNNGKVVAAAAGMAVDHLTKKHTDIPLLAYTDGKSEWTSEDIYNLDINGEIFNEKLINRILKEL